MYNLIAIQKTTFSVRRFFGVFIFAISIIILSCITATSANAETPAETPNVAVRDNAYAARFVTQSEKDPININAGATKTITITFKNTGSATWSGGSGRYISAYTMDPRYRESEFAGSNWISKKQTAKIPGTVKPGEVGTLSFVVTAPKKPGVYTEKFYLAAENYSWVDGGYFFLKFSVAPAAVVATPAVSASAPAAEETVASTEGAAVLGDTGNSVGEPVGAASASESIEPVEGGAAEGGATAKPAEPALVGKRIGQNVKEVWVEGAERIKVIALFQNLGETSWDQYALYATDPENTSLTFADKSWHDDGLVLTASTDTAPGASIRAEFYFRAPTKKGDYVAEFPLNVNTKDLSDVQAKVLVHVTKDAPSTYNSPKFYASPEIDNDLKLAAEPRIRVGMELPMDFVQFRSEEEDYNVVVAGQVVGVLPRTHLGVFKFDNTYYSFIGADVNYEGPAFVRLEPQNNPHAVFALSNYSRHVSWKGPNNFNTYRGAFEYQQGKVDKKLYAVNDLLLEDYVAGIAETSNVSNIDYIKALLTAARTYAYDAKGKYPFFDVLGNTYDQLYLGYESERLMDRVAQAARETRGYMVTYGDEIVVTPYFANSNGTTKSWAQVWGGRTPRPWLVPVSAEYDRGRTQHGHGVGMSARDASLRAEKEGVDWQTLLKHYYTGVEIEKIYN